MFQFTPFCNDHVWLRLGSPCCSNQKVSLRISFLFTNTKMSLPYRDPLPLNIFPFVFLYHLYLSIYTLWGKSVLLNFVHGDVLLSLVLTVNMGPIINTYSPTQFTSGFQHGWKMQVVLETTHYPDNDSCSKLSELSYSDLEVPSDDLTLTKTTTRTTDNEADNEANNESGHWVKGDDREDDDEDAAHSDDERSTPTSFIRSWSRYGLAIGARSLIDSAMKTSLRRDRKLRCRRGAHQRLSRRNWKILTWNVLGRKGPEWPVPSTQNTSNSMTGQSSPANIPSSMTAPPRAKPTTTSSFSKRPPPSTHLVFAECFHESPQRSRPHCEASANSVTKEETSGMPLHSHYLHEYC